MSDATNGIAAAEYGNEAFDEYGRTAEDRTYYAEAQKIMPSREELAELARRNPGPPPEWWDDEDWDVG